MVQCKIESTKRAIDAPVYALYELTDGCQSDSRSLAPNSDKRYTFYGPALGAESYPFRGCPATLLSLAGHVYFHTYYFLSNR
jgi:hypothetical protein